MIGRTISHYTILEKLGAGGMGEIYKAQDTRLNRVVAMKVLSTANAGDVERRRRFVQEAQAASALNHPNIITIHDVVSTDGLEFIVMEFVSGVTLDDLIPTHGLNAQKTLDIGVQIADALQAAHAAGIVHRDLKPANVMVTSSGLVKILDFGIAKLTGPIPAGGNTDETLPFDAPMTVEGSILGTVSYMSPEQAQARTVDPRSDIFSFGLVLYEMLTGRKAFLGDSALSTLSSILRDEAKPIGDTVQGVPPELQQIVDRAMRKEPDRRWQSMQDMRAALLVLKQKSDSGVLQAQLTAAALAAAPNKSGMPPVLLVTAAVVVLASIGAGGWWWIKQREAQRTPPVVAQVAPASRPPVPAAPAAPPSPADAAMTNQDVLKMVGAKVPESIVIGQIKASKTNFDLSPNGVIQLATGGVSKNIIDVMRDPKADSSAAPATPPTAVSSRTDSVSVAGGTPLDITLAEDVPAKLTAGQKIDFTVTKDVEVGDVVVISKGTELSGEIVDTGESKKLGILKTKATFKLTVVNSTGGTPLAIRATPGHSDKTDRPIELSGAKKNKEVLAAAGARYLGYIDGDQSVKIKR